MDLLTAEWSTQLPLELQPLEMAERKGLGHPDTLCDLMAEAISQALCTEYLRVAGRVLHHNIENAFLVAGRSEPAFGGGRVLGPMRFVYGDHATTDVDGRPLAVDAIAEAAALGVLQQLIPHLDGARHIVFQNELRPGSAQLVALVHAERAGANDTCIGSDFAPLSETETLIVAAERFLNSAAFKAEHPETGCDAKVTGVRRCSRLDLVISLAFIGERVPSERFYFEAKAAICERLRTHLAPMQRRVQDLVVHINTADRRGAGADGVYLTVLGTAADGADGGQVGRGNRPCGLNSFARPLAAGAVAGKNPAAAVGKIYTLFAHHVAARIHQAVPGLAEVYVWLASSIGERLDRPLTASLRLGPAQGCSPDPGRAAAARELLAREIEGIYAFAESLRMQPQPVC